MKKQQSKAVVAELDILNQYDCSISVNDNIDVFTHSSGWKFHSSHKSILKKNEINELISRINSSLRSRFSSLANLDECDKDDDHIIIDNYKLHIPPMLFDNDMHAISFESYSINISAGDALECWAAQVIFKILIISDNLYMMMLISYLL